MSSAGGFQEKRTGKPAASRPILFLAVFQLRMRILQILQQPGGLLPGDFADVQLQRGIVVQYQHQLLDVEIGPAAAHFGVDFLHPPGDPLHHIQRQIKPAQGHLPEDSGFAQLDLAVRRGGRKFRVQGLILSVVINIAFRMYFGIPATSGCLRAVP